MRELGRGDAADEIVTTTKAAGYDVRESDPFFSARRFSGQPENAL